METLESSRVCRLCGKQSGISINIFDKNENHVKKINAVLPIMVHEMDLLPKHMCHRCSYKLEEFHKFYMDCLKTDAGLKSQLSWMRKEERADEKERIGIPMVHIENIKIKVEPPDYDIYELDPIVENVNYINSMSSVTFPVKSVRTSSIREGIAYAAYASCEYCCDKKDQSNRTVSPNYEKVNGEQDASNHFGNLANVEVRNGFRDHRSSSSVNKGSKDAERYTVFAGGKVNSSTITGDEDTQSGAREVATSTVVRNLRPRKTSVDYVGTKTKNRVLLPPESAGSNFGVKPKIEEPEVRSTFEFDSTRIKIERDEDYEGRRILRPRTRFVDYTGHKKKYTKSKLDKNQRSLGTVGTVGTEECGTKRHALRNIGKESKALPKKVSKLLAVEDSIKFAIKRELLSDPEDTVLQETTSVKSAKSAKSATLKTATNRAKSIANQLPKNAKPLANNELVNVQNEIRVSSFHRTQHRKRLRVPNELKSLAGSATENSSKTGKLDIRQISAIRFNSKYLRSQYPYLRNGKVKQVHEGEKPLKRLRKNIIAMKYLDRDIKHYCEKCNISFANKELFKLHECYD